MELPAIKGRRQRPEAATRGVCASVLRLLLLLWSDPLICMGYWSWWAVACQPEQGTTEEPRTHSPSPAVLLDEVQLQGITKQQRDHFYTMLGRVRT